MFNGYQCLDELLENFRIVAYFGKYHYKEYNSNTEFEKYSFYEKLYKKWNTQNLLALEKIFVSNIDDQFSSCHKIFTAYLIMNLHE